MGLCHKRESELENIFNWFFAIGIELENDLGTNKMNCGNLIIRSILSII